VEKIMRRISRIGVVMTALMSLALPACQADAQGLAAKVNAAPVRVKAPVIKDPSLQLGTGAQNLQHSSDWGVQMNIRHKRDRLQRASKAGAIHTD
jgi:hypothetical protein